MINPLVLIFDLTPLTNELNVIKYDHMKAKEPLVIIKLNKPSNLNLEELIKPDLDRMIRVRRDDGSFSIPHKSGKSLRKYIPALYYLVHVLLERQYSKNSEKCWFGEDYVKMYSRDIEPLKSKNDFRYMWGILLQLDVIKFLDAKEPTRYRKSAMGYYFRFTNEYRDSAVVQHEIQVKTSISEKLDKKEKFRKYEAKVSSDIKSIKMIGPIYLQYQSLQNLIFDSQAAINHCEKQLNEKALDTKQYNSYIITINNIINGRMTFSHSVKCKRIYTTITLMPKELRKYIKDNDGNALTELDFGSFNPFLVYKIFNEMSPEYSSDIEKIAFENELDLYRRLLSTGDFYRNFKEMFFQDKELTRDQVKDIVLKNWFNGRPNSRNKFRKHILKRLPRISGIIDSMKKERYEDFSNFTMSRESQLVNDIVYMKFIEINPQAILYTIFDSFLVEQKYAAQLQTMMLEEGSRYFNLNCIVKAKNPA